MVLRGTGGIANQPIQVPALVGFILFLKGHLLMQRLRTKLDKIPKELAGAWRGLEGLHHYLSTSKPFQKHNCPQELPLHLKHVTSLLDHLLPLPTSP